MQIIIRFLRIRVSESKYCAILRLLVFSLVLLSCINIGDTFITSGENKFEKIDAQKQLTSAKIMQRSNVVIMPLVFASWVVGVFAEYEQNVALYGTFTILNGVTL